MTVKMPLESTPRVRIIRRRRVHDGFQKMDIVTLQPRSLRHDGWAPEMTRDMMIGHRAATVLPYIPETDEILLSRQFRAGAYLCGAADPFLYECAAGIIDDGEDPAAAARREALEETGTRLADIIPACHFYSSPGCLAEEFFSFVGRIAKPETGIFGLEAEGEEIATALFAAEDVFAMADNGTITNGPSILLINWFARHRDRIRHDWLQKENT